MAAFPDMLRKARERNGFTVGQVAWRIGVKPAEYRELEAGTRWPTFEAWDAICKLFAAGGRGSSAPAPHPTPESGGSEGPR